jgi:hypothetical protein
MLTRRLSGVERASVLQDDEVVRIELEREGELITVVWTMAPRPMTVTVAAHAQAATLVDKYGAERSITPDGGAYRLTLAPATANTVPDDPSRYLIGGDPILIVETLGR